MSTTIKATGGSVDRLKICCRQAIISCSGDKVANNLCICECQCVRWGLSDIQPPISWKRYDGVTAVLEVGSVVRINQVFVPSIPYVSIDSICIVQYM